MRPGARALNKSLLIVGIDRKLAGLAFLLAVIVGSNDSLVAKAAALILFIAFCWAGRTLTRKDPNLFAVMSQVWRQKAFYDPLKREFFRLEAR